MPTKTMTAATHPWTFVHPTCGKPAFHRASIPHVATPAIGAVREFENLDGTAPLPGDVFRCQSCLRDLGPVDMAAMTVEANWRRREGAAA